MSHVGGRSLAAQLHASADRALALIALRPLSATLDILSPIPMFEPVYAVLDYYDQPRVGVASCDGLPQLFESEWDEAADDYLSSFKLWPLDEATLELVREQWTIWLRWDEAFHGGRTELSTHPALPEDRPRWDDLKLVVDRRLEKAKAGASSRKKGNFRRVDRQNYEVEWLECDV